MKENKLEEFKLEIILLQKKDYQNALDMGINNKKEWYEYIIKQPQDEIADAIIDLANRYEIPIEKVADLFDATMVIRVGKLMEKQKKDKSIR